MIELQQNEDLLLLRRRHWIVLAFGMARIIIAMLVVGLAPLFVAFFLPEVISGHALAIFFGELLFLQVCWMLLFLTVIDYYLDAWIVTNKRLIFIELHGLFSRTLSSIEFSRIEDISVDVSGIIPTFFNYGDIKVHSAGNEEGFTFEDVPKPYALKDELLAIRERVKNEL